MWLPVTWLFTFRWQCLSTETTHADLQGLLLKFRQKSCDEDEDEEHIFLTSQNPFQLDVPQRSQAELLNTERSGDLLLRSLADDDDVASLKPSNLFWYLVCLMRH